MTAAETYTIAEEDRLRADLYNFMGVILSGPPDDMLLGQTAGLQGDSTDLGQAISTLAKMARITKPRTVESEYNRLFIGLGPLCSISKKPACIQAIAPVPCRPILFLLTLLRN